MTFDELREALETTFNTGWGVTTPIAWENVMVNIPDTSWVRFSIIPAASINVVIGIDVPRLVGFAAVQIFCPLDLGTGDAWRLADSVLAILQNKYIGSIITYAGTVTNVGEGVRRVKDVESGYYQLNVMVPYEAQ